MTWRRVRRLTGLAALLLALALGMDVLGGRLGGPDGLRSLAAAALAFASVAVLGVGTFTPSPPGCSFRPTRGSLGRTTRA